LNISGDPQLEKLRADVESKLAKYSADELRKDKVSRADAAKAARALAQDIALASNQGNQDAAQPANATDQGNQDILDKMSDYAGSM
jgi:hypothetical protein